MSTEHPVEQHSETLSRLRHEADDHERRLATQERTSAAREEQIKALNAAVSRIEQICIDLRQQVQAMISKTENDLLDGLEKLSARVAALEAADGAKWQRAVGYVLSAAIGAAVLAMINAGKHP